MLGVIGIVLSLGLLIVLAYRGWNVILIAPICAVVALLMSGLESPILATYTQIYMPALGKYLAQFFPLFLLGAVFGKLMDDSGAARTIARSIAKRVGHERVILAVVIACGILTYGGVSLFVVAFAVFPVAFALFRDSDTPRRLIPAAIALGSFTFTMTALPGTPAIQNAIPMPYFKTDTFAAPGLSTIAALIMFVTGCAWLILRARRARKAGQGFDHAAPPRAPSADEAGEDPGARGPASSLPSFGVAIIPIVVVLLLNYLLSRVILPSVDASYLSKPEYGETSIGEVKGTWAIIVAMIAACLVLLALTGRRLTDPRGSLTQGTLGSMLPVLNVSSEVGYGAVISSLGAFVLVRDWLRSVIGDPVVGLAVIVNVLAGITGSASGGMSIALEAVGQQYLEQAQANGTNPELLHRVAAISAGGLDVLPHNGAVVTLLAICGLPHRSSYFDIFMVSLVFPVLSLVVLIALSRVFGSF